MLDFHHANATQPTQLAVIAEIGVNHDGSVDRARELIDAAKEAGADAVKFQSFDPATLVGHDAPLAEYQRGQAQDPKQMLDALRLPQNGFRVLRKHAEDVGLAFVVTPFGVGDAAALADLQLDAVKIASPDAVNPWLLEAAASLGVPLLISTGTCDLPELEFAAALLRDHAPGGAFLHCVSAYPTPIRQAALGGVAALRVAFGQPTGYSDHTPAVKSGGWAVLAGVCLLEKHLTHDRNAAGPDHAASLEPTDFRIYVEHGRHAVDVLGPQAKACSEAERDVRRVARQSVVYAANLPAGHRLTRADLCTRRPATGVPAAEGDAYLGRTLNTSVQAGQRLAPEHLGSAGGADP